MPLGVLEKEVEGVKVLALSGRITMGEESSELRNAIKRLLNEGAKKIVLDMGEITYIDSSGLGALVSAHSTATNAGANIKLANLTKRFHELLGITKLVTVFDVYGDVQSAVKSFQ
jgi:anti-sigma B factor antagonist